MREPPDLGWSEPVIKPPPELRLRVAIREALEAAKDYGYALGWNMADSAIEECEEKFLEAKEQVESQLRLAEIQVKLALGLETEAIEQGHAIMAKAEADELRVLRNAARRIQGEARGSRA